MRLTILLMACSAFAQPQSSRFADLVLRNGKIVTLNAATPIAQAVSIRGDRIAAVGRNADAARWTGPNTKVIDLRGMLAVPGFIEGHGHFTRSRRIPAGPGPARCPHLG